MPINFNSENYSNQATEFYENLKREDYEKNFSPRSLSDVMSNQLLSNTIGSFIQGSADSANYIYNSMDSKYILNSFDDTAQNLFSPFRVNPVELMEGIEAQNNLFSTQIESIVDEMSDQTKDLSKDEKLSLLMQGSPKFAESVKTALNNPELASTYLNSRLFGNIQFDTGQRFFDLTKAFDASAYQNAGAAPNFQSVLGKSLRVMGEQANQMRLRQFDKNMLQQVIESLPEDHKLKGTNLDELFRTQAVKEEIDLVNYRPDDNWFTGGFRKIGLNYGVSALGVMLGLGDNTESEYLTYETMFGREDGIDKLLLADDKSWEGTEDTPGVRDLLAAAIQTSDNPEIREYLSKNRNILEDLRNSKNSVAFAAGLNKRQIEYNVGEFVSRSDGFGVAGTMNMLGYGFTTDPSLPLDIAATAVTLGGWGLLKGSATVIRGTAAGASSIFDSMLTAQRLNTATNTMENVTKLGRLGKGLKTVNNYFDIGLDGVGRAVGAVGTGVANLQRIIPTQIVSELLFPTAKFALSTGKSKGATNLYTYLNSGNYLPKSMGGKLAYRAMSGASEGVVWGYLEYEYATAVEDVMNEAFYGEETANAMAYQREQTGAMLQSMLISGVMGGMLSPVIGATFDGVMGAGKDLAAFTAKQAEAFELKRRQKADEIVDDDYIDNLNGKVEEKIAQRNEESRLFKLGQVGKKALRNMGNRITSNSSTGDSRMGAAMAFKNVEFGEDETTAASNRQDFEAGFEKGARVARRGGLNFKKAVKNVINSLKDGEKLSPEEMVRRVREDLQEQSKLKEYFMRQGTSFEIEVAKQEAYELNTTATQVEIAEKSTDGKAPATEEQIKERQKTDVSKEAKEQETVVEKAEEKLETAVEDAKSDAELLTKKKAQLKRLEGKGKRAKPSREKLKTEIDELEAKTEENIKTLQAESLNVRSERAKLFNITAKAAKENAPFKAQDAADYRKRLKAKVQEDLKGIEGASAASVMLILGMDTDLINRFLSGNITEAEKAVLLKLKNYDAADSLTPDELNLIKEIVNKDFLEAIKGRDYGAHENYYHTLINRGVSPEEAFEASRFYQLAEELRGTGQNPLKDVSEMGTDRVELAKEGLRKLEDGEAKVKEFEDALQIVKDEEDKLLNGDLEELGFGHRTVQQLARALDIKLGKKTKEKLIAEIKQKFADGLSERERDSYSKVLSIISASDTFFNRETVKKVQNLIEQSIEAQKEDLLSREVRRILQDDEEYTGLQTQRFELLGPARTARDAALKSQEETMGIQFTEEGLKQQESASTFATEEVKAKVKEIEEKLKEIRKQTRERVDEGSKQFLQNKARLESERIMIELRPPLGFVVPLSRLLMKTSSFFMLERQKANRLKGSVIEGGFEFDNTISRADLLGLLASENMFVLLPIIEKMSGRKNNFDGEIVLSAMKDALYKADKNQAPAFLKSIDDTYNRVFNREIEGTPLFEGEGGVRNQLDFNQETIEAGARRAKEWSEVNGGQRYNGQDVEPISIEEWNDTFRNRLFQMATTNDSIDTGNLRTEGQVEERVLALFNADLPEGNRLKSFDQLGGDVDLLSPTRAAAAVVQALTTQREGTSRVTGRRAVAGSRGVVEQASTLGARRNTKIQERSDSVIADMYSEYDLNDKIAYLLQAEYGDIEKVYQWLKSFKINPEVIPNRSRDTGMLMLPTQAFESLTSTLPTGIDAAIAANQAHFISTDPAFMSTVHDAVFPMFASIVVGDAMHFNSRFKIEGTNINPFQGLGWGFPVGIARGGSFQAGVLVASEITFQYKNLFNTARAAYDQKYEKEYGMDFAEFFFGGGLEKLPSEQRKKVQDELFPSIVEEFDADSSGSNIMLSIVQGVEGKQALREFFRTILKDVDEEDGTALFDKFIDDNYTTIYDKVQDAVLKDLQTNKIDDLLSKNEAELGKYRPALAMLKNLFDSAEDLGIDLKGIFKSPTMTDLYQAGAKTMGDAIYAKFFNKPEIKAKLIDSGIIKAVDYDTTTILASSLLGKLFNETAAPNEIAWIKSTLFPGRAGANKITNAKLQEYFNKFKQTREDEIATGTAIKEDASDLINTGEEGTEAAIARLRGVVADSEDNDFNTLLRSALGMAKVLTDNSFFGDRQEGARVVASVVDNWLRKVTDNEDLKSAIEKGQYDKAKTIYRELATFDTARNIKAQALNSYARQGFRFNKESFSQMFTAMFGKTNLKIDDILNNMSPMARRSFEETFYNNLATSDHGRMYVPSGQTMISEKTFRQGEIYSIAEMVDDINIDLGSLKENIRRLTILDLAIRAAEFTDTLPKLGDEEYKAKTYYDFLNQWEADSQRADQLRAAAIRGLRTIEQDRKKIAARVDLEDKDELLERNEIIQKMLTKIVDSTGEKRPDRIASIMEDVTGAEETSQVNFLPSAFGFLPKTYTNKFEGAPSGLIRRVQLERSNTVRRMRSLEEAKRSFTGPKVSEDPFSVEDFAAARLIPEDLALIKPINISRRLGPNVYDSYVANLDTAPPLPIVAEMAKLELDNFVATVKNEEITKLQKDGRYDQILLNYYAYSAAQNGLNKNKEVQIKSDEVQELIDYKTSQEYSTLKDEELRIALENDIDVQIAQKELNALIDASIIERENMVRGLTQWGFDAKNRVTDLYSLEGDTIDSIPVKEGVMSIEEAIQNTIYNNDMEAGNLLAWLAGDATFLGQILTKDGSVEVVSSRGSDAQIAMNAKVAFAGGDSAALYLALYAMNYAKRHAVQKLLGEDYDVTSLEISVFSDYWYKKFEGKDVSYLEELHPELYRRFEETDRATIQDLLDEGTNLASDNFNNDYILKETTRSMPLTEAVANDIKKMFPGIERRLQKQDMTIKDLLMSKSEDSILDPNKHKVFVNQFGEPTSPHHIKGKARVRLLPVEKLNAVNSIGNKKLIDAIKFAYALDPSGKLPFAKSLSSVIGGHDPFSSVGKSISEVRSNAVMMTQAVKYIMKGKGLEVQKDNRNKVFFGNKSQDAEFLFYRPGTIKSAFDNADNIVAESIFEDIGEIDNLRLNEFKNTDRGSFIKAMELIPFMTSKDGIFNVYRRIETLRRNLRGEDIIDPVDLITDFNDNIKPILNEIKKAKNKKLVAKMTFSIENGRNRNNITADPQSIDAEFGRGDAQQTFSDTENASSFVVNGEELTSDPTGAQAAFDANVETEVAFSPRTDSAEPGSGLNTVDEVLSDGAFNEQGTNHGRFLRILNILEKDGTITETDTLLLKAVFFDKTNGGLLKKLFEEVDVEIETDPDISGGRAETKTARRIRIAKKLSESFADISEFGAVGVILEELGHIIGQRMSKEGMTGFLTRAREMLKSKEGFDKFVEAEQTIFGNPENRINYKDRKEQLIADISTEKIDNLELFGPMFAMAVLLGNDVRAFMKGNDAKVLNEGHKVAKHYITRYNQYKNLVDTNLPNFVEAVGLGKMADENLTSVTDFNSSKKSSDSIRKKPKSQDIDDADLPPNELSNEGPKKNFRHEEDEIARIDRIIQEHISDDGFFNPLEIQSETTRLKAISRFMEAKIKQVGSGELVDSPMASVISGMVGGMLSRQQVERLVENISQPFGARKFAFLGENNSLSGTMLWLLQALDTKNLISSSSFGTNLPTIHGLGLQLKATFEPLMTRLLHMKTANFSDGMGRGGNSYKPYDLFTDMYWEITMNRERRTGGRYTGEIKGWDGRENAMKIGERLLEAAAEKSGTRFDVKSKNNQFIIENVVDMVEMWSNPTNGIWKKILAAQVDSGAFDSGLADRLQTEGVVPIKLADSSFRNDGTDGVQGRELLREALSTLVETELVKSDFIEEDLFKVIFADAFEGDNINGPTRINMTRLRDIYANEYINKFTNDSNKAFQALIRDIKSGKLTKSKIFSTEEINTYNKQISESMKRTEAQEKMIESIQDKRAETLQSSQMRTSDSVVNKLSDLVAEGYAQKFGSSSYSFIGDRFLSTSQLFDNPEVRKHLNLDPLEIFASVMRGQAAQAFDKQVFGNAFGMRGIGMGDLINTISKHYENAPIEFKDIMLNSLMQQEGAKRGMTQSEKQKFKHGLDYMKNAYKYSIGTLKWDDKDAKSIGFINMLNKLGELGAALSVGPRLAFAAMLEETPMRVTSSLKTNLTTLQKHMSDSISVFKGKEDARQFLQGLGFITQDLMYENNAMLAKIGLDDNRTGPDGLDSTEKLDQVIKRIYKFTATGLDTQVQANRAAGVRKMIVDMNELFYRMTDEHSLGPDKDGNETFVSPVEDKFIPTFDDLYNVFKNVDISRIDNTQLNRMLKDMGFGGDRRNVVIDLLKNGLFSEELAPVFKQLWRTYGDEIRAGGIPFDKMLNDVSFDYNTGAKERATKLQVINAFREITWQAATRFAKQPSLSEAPAIGARALGPFAKLATSLTTYSSTVYGGLRKAGYAGMGLMASAVMAHALSGYMYYKLIQLQNSKSFEEMVAEMKRDPMQELQEAIMSVPFFGMNQMVIATLLQVLRGQRPQNTQIYNLAGIAMVNRMLQLPTRVVNAFASINEGNGLKGAANVSAVIPLPYMAILTAGIRSSEGFMKNDQTEFRYWSPYESGRQFKARPAMAQPQQSQQPMSQLQQPQQPQQQPMRQPRAAQPSRLDTSYIESPSDLKQELNSIIQAPE